MFKLIKNIKNKLNIEHHYDLSNEFYKLFLDKNLVYTCAYYKKHRATLSESQLNKIDLIFKKIKLKPNDSLLDIGCGWGALLFRAVEKYKVKATGITLSKQQFAYIKSEIKRKNIEKHCNVILIDILNFNPIIKYTKITSIEMYEQLGINTLPSFFAKINSLLSPSGIFLMQGLVAGQKQNKHKSYNGHVFMDKYIFPGGQIPNLGTLLTIIKKQKLNLISLEKISHHYVKTLLEWLKNLEKNKKSCLKYVSEKQYKLWTLYIAGSAVSFEEGTMDNFQLVFDKNM